MSWSIVCDFDGTIAPHDVTDRLLEHFASPPWRSIEHAWQEGQISSRQCLQQQTELLRMTRAELHRVLDAVAIDPAFVKFVHFAQSQGCNVCVASDGFDQVIRFLLRIADCPPLHINATYLVPSGCDRWLLGFPFARTDCDSAAATCKCAVARGTTAAMRRLLVVGDGQSDFCVATRADFVFARGKLLQFCRDQGLPHAAVADFSVAEIGLTTLLGKSLTRSAFPTTLGHVAKDTIRE